MKKIILIVLLTTLLLIIGEVYSVFCCEDPETGQKKCYSTGQCCDDLWVPVCFWFDVWVEPTSRMFTVGESTTVNLYIHNVCPYPDNYDVTYDIIVGNPNLIKVDLTGFECVEDVGPKEIRVIYPRITILEKSATGSILFNATSEGNNTVYNNATLTVLQGDLPVSLPEFDYMGLFVIIFLIGILYFIYKKNL